MRATYQFHPKEPPLTFRTAAAFKDWVHEGPGVGMRYPVNVNEAAAIAEAAGYNIEEV
jgi:hypothetical protein